MTGNSGTRYNSGKRKWGLLSWAAVSQIVEVLEFGAKKYSAWNWTKGLSWSECFESMQRHLVAWYSGEDKDPETGLSHMAHVLCNAMFLMHFILFKTGADDRPAALKGDTPQDAEPTKLDQLKEALALRNPLVVGGMADLQENVRS